MLKKSKQYQKRLQQLHHHQNARFLRYLHKYTCFALAKVCWFWCFEPRNVHLNVKVKNRKNFLVNQCIDAASKSKSERKKQRDRTGGKQLKGFRVCADYSNYPLPCLENIFLNLNGGKLFSKVDLSDAYLETVVDESCKKLLELYKFDELPFGVKVTPNIFQQIMDAMLTELDFSVTYLDDILIRSKNRKEHAKHIEKVFERIKDFDFKVSNTTFVCVYLCSCIHIMSILCSTADAVSSASWSILFKVLTLNVAICIVCLHFSSFCCLNSVAPTSAGCPFFKPREERCGLCMWFECGSWLSFDIWNNYCSK